MQFDDLLTLPGVGPVTASALAEAGFDSRAALAAAGAEDLQAIPGIGPAKAAALLAAVRPDAGEEPGAREAGEFELLRARLAAVKARAKRSKKKAKRAPTKKKRRRWATEAKRLRKKAKKLAARLDRAEADR